MDSSDSLQRHFQFDVPAGYGGGRRSVATAVPWRFPVSIRLNDQQSLVRRHHPLLAKVAGLIDVGGDDHAGGLIRREHRFDALLRRSQVHHRLPFQ